VQIITKTLIFRPICVILSSNGSRERVYKRLFREYYPQLYAFAYGMVKDEEACRDIIGDAFEKLWTQLDDIKDGNERGHYSYSQATMKGDALCFNEKE
jgi:DNA-directed RNA polymerase specialized sigma24 family protein